MSESTRSSDQLPPPVTANGRIAYSGGQTGVERSAAPSLIALAGGLVALSSNQPRAELLFIGAGTVALGLYFVVPPSGNEKSHPIVTSFLRRVPSVFTAFGCILIMLGIGNAFPHEIALIPLFLFISFSALAALSGTTFGVWTTAALYCAALGSLVSFVVVAFMP